MNRSFWKQAFALQGSVTPRVMPRVALFAAFAELIYLLDQYSHWSLKLDIAPYEVAGAVLGILLVMRINAGYDRWWEARKLWGGIVNQSRNMAISYDAYGPASREMQRRFIRLAALFPHAARCFLRGESPLAEANRLVGPVEGERIASANHPAIRISQLLAAELRKASQSDELDRFAFLQVDRERALLIDHMGACERILRSPLPTVYAIKIRRFLLLFLATLPFPLLGQVGELTPLIVALVGYTLLSVDQIGVELEDPFSIARLSHLPLGTICQTIESNLFEILASGETSEDDQDEARLDEDDAVSVR